MDKAHRAGWALVTVKDRHARHYARLSRIVKGCLEALREIGDTGLIDRISTGHMTTSAQYPPSFSKSMEFDSQRPQLLPGRLKLPTADPRTFQSLVLEMINRF